MSYRNCVLNGQLSLDFLVRRDEYLVLNLVGIDLFRLSLLNRSAASVLSRGFLEKLWSSLSPFDESKTTETNWMLSTRAICNAFSMMEAHSILNSQKETVRSII